MALTPVCAGRVVVAAVRVMTSMVHNPKAVQACVRLLESLVEMVRPSDGWMERAFGLSGATPTHPHTHTDDTHTHDVQADEGHRGADGVCVCGADEHGATHGCVCASVGEGVGGSSSTHGCGGGSGLECLQRVMERSRDNGPVRLLRKLVQSVDAMVDAVVDTTTSGTGSRLLEAVFQAVRRRLNGNAAMAMSNVDTETTDDDEEMRWMGFGGDASSSDETKEETRLAEEKDDSVPFLASRLAALRERMVAHRAMMRRRERDRGQPGSGGAGGGSGSILREGGTHRPPSPPQPPPPSATYRPPPSSSSTTYRRATGMLFGGIDDDDDDDGDDSMDEEDFLALHSVMMPSAALRATAAAPPSTGTSTTSSTDHRQRYLEYSRLRHARYATASSATAGPATNSGGEGGGPIPAEGSIEQLMTEVLELVEVLMRGRESVVTPSGVKVSSGHSTAHHLFAKWQDDASVASGPNAGGFWQSHGSPPHWVQFNLPSNWSEVQLRTENFEQGYSVKDLSVHVGGEVDPFPAFAVEASMFDTDDDDSPVAEHMPPEMTEVASLILDQKDAWVTLLKREDMSTELRDSVRIFKLQIKSNHQGLNCKIRRLRVLAKRTTSEKGAHTRESLKVAVVEAGALHALVDILKRAQTFAPTSSVAGIPSASPSSNATRSMQATIRARAFRVLRTLVDDVRAVPGIQEVNTVQRCGVEPPPRSRPVQCTRSGADLVMGFPMGAPSLAVTDQDSSSGILEWRITHSTTSSSSSSTSSSSASSRKLPSYSPSTSQHGYFAVTVQAAAPPTPTTTTTTTTNPATASTSSSSSGAGRLYSPASGHHRPPLVVVRTPGHPRTHTSSSSSAPTSSSSSSSSPYGGNSGGASSGGNTQVVDRELAMQGRTLTLRLDALSGTLSIITDQPLPGQSSNTVVIQLPPSCASTPVTMGISAGQGASITFHDARLSTDQSLAAAHSSAMARRMEREREREARMEGRYLHHHPPPGSFGAYMSYRERLAAEEEVLFRNGPFGDRLDRGMHGGPSSSSAAASSSSSSSSHSHARAELRDRVIAHLRTTMGVEQNDAQAMVEAMDEGTMIALLNGNGAPVRGSASRGGYI